MVADRKIKAVVSWIEKQDAFADRKRKKAIKANDDDVQCLMIGRQYAFKKIKRLLLKVL
jgi:hypothetical protein